MSSKLCVICGEPFYVRYPKQRTLCCSPACRSERMSTRAKKRQAVNNSNWRGGKTSHPLYHIYQDMIGRCSRPTHQSYADYGGRGIQVCERWRSDFWAFVQDVGSRPEGVQNGRHTYSLDRINNEGDYSPENTRWATYEQQSKNRRPTKIPARDEVSGQFRKRA